MAKIFTFKNKRHLPRPLAWAAAVLLKAIAFTYRIEFRNMDQAFPDKGNFIFTLWHNRILFLAPIVPKPIRQKTSALISASRDGEYIATIVRFFQVTPVRGSSSRGGLKALIQLIRELRKGQSVLLTVDGPRGPRYTVHPGAAMLAEKTGIPLLPLSINAPRHWTLKSWDGMQIPKPFSKVYCTAGTPMLRQNDESTGDFSARIGQAMEKITLYDDCGGKA